LNLSLVNILKDRKNNLLIFAEKLNTQFFIDDFLRQSVEVLLFYSQKAKQRT